MKPSDRPFRLYWRLEKLIVPRLRNSQYPYKQKLESLIQPGMNWLELGCGHEIFPAWMSSSQNSETSLIRKTNLTVGFDFCQESLRKHRSISVLAAGNIEQAPFRSDSFDLVSANMVMEHISDPAAALREIRRILKKGGIFLFHTVNILNYGFFVASFVPQKLKNKCVWMLEGRGEEDVFPTAYRFNSRKRIRKMAAECGFEIVDLELMNSTVSTALLGPLAIPELLVVKALETRACDNYRSNIIGVLRKS